MAFSTTSYNISLTGTVLRAFCKDDAGEYCDSSIDLDTVLGNADGKFCEGAYGTFRVGVEGLAKSAHDVRLDGVVLRATLKDKAGGWREASISLDDCLLNLDGCLHPSLT